MRHLTPELSRDHINNENLMDIIDAYKTWPADIRKKLSLQDLRRMDGWEMRPNPEGWAIDTSTPSPILTYNKCSVIQDDKARYLLGLIQADAERDELQRVLSEIAKIAHEGGLHGYDTNFEAMNKVRRLSLRWWKNRAPLSQSMRHNA